LDGTEQRQPRPITLDDLVALNDEIAALVRAGVPLEPALAEMAGELPGKLGRLTDALAREMARGRALADVLADPALRLPPVYRAVIEAGARAGRLPAALESATRSIRQIAEIRRGVAVAAMYPFLIVAMACLALALFTAVVAPQVLSMMRAMDVPGDRPLAWLSAAGRWAVVWGPAAAAAVLGLAGLWWFRSRRASAIASPRVGRLMGWFPWVGNTLRWTRASAFAEVLALLVENGVPLEQAVVLAAEATGDAELIAGAGDAAGRLARGEVAGAGQGLPPLLRWLLGCARRETLLAALRHAADSYHRRARRHAELARTFLPVLLTLVVGGTAVLVCALLTFIPYTTSLYRMASPFFE